MHCFSGVWSIAQMKNWDPFEFLGAQSWDSKYISLKQDTKECTRHPFGNSANARSMSMIMTSFEIMIVPLYRNNFILERVHIVAHILWAYWFCNWASVQSNVLCKLLPTPFAIKDEREALLFLYFFYDVMGFFHSLIDARKMLGWLIQEIFTFSTLQIKVSSLPLRVEFH